MIVKDIAGQSGGVFKTRYDWKDTILGLMFPKLVQRFS